MNTNSSIPKSSSSAAGRQDRRCSTLLAQRGHRRRTVRARDVSALSHRRIADPADLPRAQAARHARQDEGAATSSRSTACSSSTQQGRLSEPFYFIDHNPHESSQTWQVRRSEFDHLLLDNAREHGVHGARRRPRAGSAVRRTPRRRRAGTNRPTARSARSVPKVVVDASGQSSLLIDRLGLREWDPVLKKAALWTYWKGAYRDTGRDEGATHRDSDRGQEGLVLVHPAARRHRQRRRRRGARLPVQEPRRRKTSRRSISRKSRRAPGVQPRIANADALRHLPRAEGILVPRQAGGRRRLGAGRRRVRLPRPALFVRRAARPDVGAMAADAIADGSRTATRPRRSCARGSPPSPPAWTACAGWCASSTTASASAGSSRSTRT